MPPKKATKTKPATPAKTTDEVKKTDEETKKTEEQMETNETDAAKTTDEKNAEEHEEGAEGGEEEEEGKGETNEEYAISNAMRAKAADKAGRVDKEGISEIWIWGRPFEANQEGVGMVQLEHVRPIDFYNPFIYAAIQNAAQVNFEAFLKPPTKEGYFDSNNLSNGKLTLHYRSDFASRNMQNNFFRFIRTPGHKIVVKRSIKTRKRNNEPFRKKVDLPGIMIDVPMPMRSLVVRGIPDDADLAKVIEKLPHATEEMVEKHEIRKDARGNNCALISFKSADDAIRTHMQATEVRFDAEQKMATKVYYQAASVFYDSLLHVWEKEPADVKKKYSLAMQTTDHKWEVFGDKNKQNTKTQNVARRGPMLEEGVTPTQAKKARQSAPPQQRQGNRSNSMRGRQSTLGVGLSLGNSNRGRSGSNFRQQRFNNQPTFNDAYSGMPAGGGFDDSMMIQQRLMEQQNMIRSLQQQVQQQETMSSAMRNLQSSLSGGGGAASQFGANTAATRAMSNMNQGWGGPARPVGGRTTRSTVNFGSRY